VVLLEGGGMVEDVVDDGCWCNVVEEEAGAAA